MFFYVYTIFATEFILRFSPKYLYLWDIWRHSREMRALYEQIFGNYHVRRPIKSDVQRSLQVALNIVCICIYDYMDSVDIRRTRDSAFALCICNKAHIIIIYSR